VDYQNLFIFIKVVEKGSFIAASRALQVPSSTVSRRVQQLEESMGYRLLHRSARKLALTEAGERFYRRCLPLFSELELATQELDGELTSPSGELRITAPLAFSNEVLTPWLFEFMVLYPNIRLEMILANRNIDLLDEGIDIAFRIGEAKIKDWVGRPLFHTPFTLCASPEFVERYGEISHPSELEALPLVISRRSRQWRFKHCNGEICILEGQAKIRVDELSTSVEAVKAGLGIANLPNYVIRKYLESGDVVPLLPDWEPVGREVQMLYPHRKYLPAKVRLCIEFLMMKVEQNRSLLGR
jgi:DNA-binding transcriptional LysR family regulator